MAAPRKARVYLGHMRSYYASLYNTYLTLVNEHRDIQDMLLALQDKHMALLVQYNELLGGMLGRVAPGLDGEPSKLVESEPTTTLN